MKVKRTLIFPFEQQTHYTSTKLSLLQMAAQWLKTTMTALKENKQQSLNTTEAEIHDSIHERLLRNCEYRLAHTQKRFFKPIRVRLKPAVTNFIPIGFGDVGRRQMSEAP
ncbi:hypothetical protein ACH42_10795 [Endozoicomonas sp. (ex Bugula neritina AB1)]|nr:hypothetical protein ACH42_10795 [Endozoicomonas sp. (ex Bugula neritina AB1)]